MNKNNRKGIALQAKVHGKNHFVPSLPILNKLWKRFIKCKGYRASLCLEGAIVLPIVMFAFLQINSMLGMLESYSSILVNTSRIGSEYTLLNPPIPVLAYATGRSFMMTNQKEGYTEVIESLLPVAYIASKVDEKANAAVIQAHVIGESQFQITPIKVPMDAYYYSKLWTGYEDDEETEKEGEDEEDDEDGKTVYITETGKVYHITKECTHLKLSIKSIEASQLAKKRNKNGGKYYPCEICKPTKVGGEDKIYITEQGNKFHSKIGCSGLKRTVIPVKLEEMHGYRPCSRCG